MSTLRAILVLALLASPALAERATIKATFLRVDYDLASGRFDLLESNQVPILLGATAAVGDKPLSDAKRIGTTDELRIQGRAGELQVEHRLRLLPEKPAAIVELVLTNPTSADVIVPSADPIHVEAGESRGCMLPASMALTNGYIYYDPGNLYHFDAIHPAIKSRWNAAFYFPPMRQALVVGFLDNDRGEGQILAKRPEKGGFDLTARAMLHPAFVLKPGASISTGRVLVELSYKPHEALEHYADLCAEGRNVKLNPIINGWCSWFVYYGGVSEAEILKNAEFVARELKPYGMEWIQIDDGFYRAFGEWDGNDRFPRGMKHTADEIKKLGLKPGLWIAPYAISENTDIAKNHADWLIKDDDGKPQRIAADHANQAQYILDITHPESQKWLRDLVKTITHEWGYQFIKTDFVEWTILAAKHFHDPSVTKAQAYGLGDRLMRDARGKDVHFLDCGPGSEAVGLIDSMRIGLDRPDDLPRFKLFEQYAGHDNSTIPAVAKRYYFHNRTWINDPDHLRLAKQTLPQARAAATIIALSGGTTISGDKLYDLDRDRLEILKKVLPAYGQSARPIDLFESDQPELFALPVRTSWGTWMLAASFNRTNSRRSGRVEFARVGVKPGTMYLVYDVWAQKLLGEFNESWPAEVEPTSVQLVAIREKTDVPQLLATDRHLIGGAVELENVRWNESDQTLTGTAIGSAPMRWKLAIYVPSGYRFDATDSAAATNLADISLDGSVLRATVVFQPGQKKLDWSIKFLKT